MTRALGGRRSPYVIAHDRELVRLVLEQRSRLTDDEFYAVGALVVERLTDHERRFCERTLSRLGVAVEAVGSYKAAAKSARRKATALSSVQVDTTNAPTVLERLPLKPPGKAGEWRART